MMSYQTFLAQMSRITAHWGDKTYPSERTEKIWQSIRGIGERDFSDIIENFLAESLKPPMRSDFRMAAEPYLERAYRLQRDRINLQLQGRPGCRWCGNSGLISAQKRNVPFTCGDFVFRCDFCDASHMRRLAASVPVWQIGHGHEFWPRYATGQLCDPFDLPEGAQAPEPVQEPRPPTREEMRAIEKAGQGIRDMPLVEAEENVQEAFDL
jgi:hypothetical protein